MNDDAFLECDTCRAKRGSPELCFGCVYNRGLIGRLKKQVEELEVECEPLDEPVATNPISSRLEFSCAVTLVISSMAMLVTIIVHLS